MDVRLFAKGTLKVEKAAFAEYDRDDLRAGRRG